MKTTKLLFSKMFAKKKQEELKPTTKWCNYCKRYLPIEAFDKANYYTNGRQCYCKSRRKQYKQKRKFKKATNTISNVNKTLINKSKTMKFNQIIKERRLDLGMSQTEVAEKAGLRYQTVLKVEKGGSTTLSTLIAICKVLNLKLAVLDNNETN